MSSLFDDPVAAPIQPSDDGSAVQDSPISLLRRDMSLIIHPDANLRSRFQSGSMSLNATGQCSIATPSALFDGSKATTLCLFELLSKSLIEQFIQTKHGMVVCMMVMRSQGFKHLDHYDDSNWILNQVGTHMVPLFSKEGYDLEISRDDIVRFLEFMHVIKLDVNFVPFIAMYRKERQSLFIDPKPQDDKDNQKKSDPKPTLRWHKESGYIFIADGENDDQDTGFNGNQINEENYLDADGNDDNIRSEGL
ncbi:hypothetical protein L1987_57984 [Smallanthus sonchifolius]|uniref:Uncharacterized protein n=1 Tax=Smallanthus sonchifolius TaxID=185202 RepID=A0ACB9DEU3_9ASTR|nr:hypothetical protein L1987_57984 [Smallanthus sonchifolius]